MIEVYTDGSCLGNPGTGGWAFLILNDGGIINHFGYQLDTTNNQMELTAAIKALEFIKENDEITLFTDSSYVCLLYTSPSPRDVEESRMPSSA